MSKSPEEDLWYKLKKPYLTIDQKIAIIREHNEKLNAEMLQKTISSLNKCIKILNDLK